MKERILLPNRDGLKNYLVKYKDDKYIFQPEFDWVTAGITGSNDNIKSYDPSGGPFMTIGYVVENYIITNIEYIDGKGCVFTLKENNF